MLRPACSFPTTPVLDGPDLTNGTNGHVTLVVNIDPATSKVVPSSNSIDFNGSFCNSSTHLSLSRTPFKTAAAAQNGFGNEIFYDAYLSWGSSSNFVHLAPGTNSFDSLALAPQSGDLILKMDVPADGQLVSGQYTGTLTLSITSS